MKQAFVIGTIMLYMILLGLQMFVTDTSSTSATGVGAELHNYELPSEVTSHTNPDTGQSSTEVNAGTIATSLWNVGQMALLYFPALYGTGNYIWFYYTFCFPIAISFWVVIFTIFRGVGST